MSRPRNMRRRLFKHRIKAIKIRAFKTFHRRRQINLSKGLHFKTQSRRALQDSQTQHMALYLEVLVNKTYLTTLTLIENSSTSTILTRTVFYTLSGRTTFPAYGKTRMLQVKYELLPHQLVVAALRTSLVAWLLTAEQTTSICPLWA